MGQDYIVGVRAKVKDHTLLVKLTNEYIKTDNFSADCWDKSNLATAEGCIRALLAGDTQPEMFETRPDYETSTESDGWRRWENTFHCCYGWECVLNNWFHAIAPALEDDSRITVYPDNGKWELVVRNGLAEEVELPTYTIDELKALDDEAWGYAIEQLEYEYDGEATDPLEDDIADFAKKNNYRFYEDGTIAD